MPSKLADTAVPIHELIARRWSARAIDATRPVGREQQLALLEAARWAPSCFGAEPWRYLCWDRDRDASGWTRARECLTPGNAYWAGHAPVLLASLADSEFPSGKPDRWGQHDTGAASENLCLQGAALGLVVHQMGGFDAAMLAERFGVPPRFTPMAMIAVGHPGDASQLSEKHRERELAARSRRPLEETFFDGEWGRPWRA